MQTLIYTDASLLENGDSFIAIEIKNGDKQKVFRFENVRFKEGEHNINNIELLGIFLGISLASEYQHERVFIFCDNIVAVKNAKTFEYLYEKFTNLQIGWLQNDMPELQLVDFLSRKKFKKENNIDIDKLDYKSLKFDDNILFERKKFDLYTQYNFLFFKRILGFEPKKEDLNLFIFDNIGEFKNNKHLNDTVKTFDPDFIEETEIISKKTIQNKNESEVSFFVSEEEEPSCIIGEDILSFKEVIEKKLFKIYFPKGLSKSVYDLLHRILLKNINDIENDLKNISKINDKNEQTFVILFLKIFDNDKYQHFFRLNQNFSKRDYKRGRKSILRFFNKKGCFFYPVKSEG